MNNIIDNIEDVLTEWAVNVDNGTPDVKNKKHLIVLERVLFDMGFKAGDIFFGLERLSGLTEATYVDNYKNRRLNRVGKEWGTGGKQEPKKKEEPEKEEPEAEEKPKLDKEKGSVHGDPSEGDNRDKNDVLEYGYGGIEDKTGKKPAPGGAGSAFNEIISGEGVHILDDNPNLTEEQLARKIYEDYGDTTLGQEQKKTSGIPIPNDLKEAKKKAKESGDKEALKKAEQNIATYSKCIIAARSAKKKYQRTQDRVKNLQKKGKFGKPKKTHTFYGTEQSKVAQKEAVDKAKKVLLPNGVVVDKEDMKKFIEASGGGKNPSDTSTFVEDDEGNLMVQFHSDKTTTGDIQDNSTLNEETDRIKNSIQNDESLTSDEASNALGIMETYDSEVDSIEEKYVKQTGPIAKKLTELPIEGQLDIIEKDKGTLKKNIHEAIFVKKSGKFRDKYEKYLPKGEDGEPKDPENLTPKEKYEMVRQLVADDEGGSKDAKAINKVAGQLQEKNPDIKGIDVKKILSEERKRAVSILQERRNQLNEIKPGLGDKLEANDVIRGFHLGLLDDKEYDPNGSDDSKMEAILDGSFDINMGGAIVDKEVMRECTGTSSSKDFKDNFKIEDNEELTYDSDEKDEEGNPLGNVTGKKVHTYIIKGKDKKKIPIGFRTYRSKAGATGKSATTMTYSKEIQDCFKEKNK
jgi:hypothetical protein